MCADVLEWTAVGATQFEEDEAEDGSDSVFANVFGDGWMVGRRIVARDASRRGRASVFERFWSLFVCCASTHPPAPLRERCSRSVRPFPADCPLGVRSRLRRRGFALKICARAFPVHSIEVDVEGEETPNRDELIGTKQSE